MTSLVLVLALLAACGGKHQPEPAPVVSNQTETPATAPGEPGLTKPQCDIASTACAMRLMRYYADAACACKDKACVEALTADITAWARDSAHLQKPGKPTGSEAKEMEAVGKRLGECMVRVLSEEAEREP